MRALLIREEDKTHASIGKKAHNFVEKPIKDVKKVRLAAEYAVKTTDDVIDKCSCHGITY